MSADLIAALRNAGGLMANVAYNLAQKPGHALTSDDVALLDKLRRDWDEALRAALAAAPEQQARPVAEVTEVDLHADHQGPVEAYAFLPVGTKLYASAPEQCRCQRLGDFDGNHHPLCEGSAAPAPAPISAVPEQAEPDDALLTSMAIRFDHGLGLPGYYDQPMLATPGVTHAQLLESTKRTMRQLWEEVVGAGFYRPQAAPAPAPIAQPQPLTDASVFKDAMRYRWQREQWCTGEEETGLEPVMHVQTPEEYDAEIDAAMRAKPAAGIGAQEQPR